MFVGLGSNLGDRAAYLRRAVEALEGLPRTSVVRVSSVYETRPWGLVDQPDFLNQVAELRTSLGPVELLRSALAIEDRLGRQRTVRWGPRTVDIDLLLYDDLVMDTPELTLPHPRMLQRAFVLVPLAELEPQLQVAGRTVADHLHALGDWRRDVRRVGGAACPPGTAARPAEPAEPGTGGSPAS